MGAQRVWMALPYAVMLCIAAWFYQMAGAIAYTHRGDNLGPDFWPRIALGAMMIICAVQCGRLLIFGRASDTSSVIDLGDEDEEAPRSGLLLAAGLVLTTGYCLAMPVIGFLISTVLFLALFMYAGRYRAPVPILLTSVGGALVALLLFQKVVYVSLPRGIPPFDAVADLILKHL